jgi:hypothetical protein
MNDFKYLTSKYDTYLGRGNSAGNHNLGIFITSSTVGAYEFQNHMFKEGSGFAICNARGPGSCQLSGDNRPDLDISNSDFIKTASGLGYAGITAGDCDANGDPQMTLDGNYIAENNEGHLPLQEVN